jgi:hypothetical protein
MQNSIYKQKIDSIKPIGLSGTYSNKIKNTTRTSL